MPYVIAYATPIMCMIFFCIHLVVQTSRHLSTPGKFLKRLLMWTKNMLNHLLFCNICFVIWYFILVMHFCFIMYVGNFIETLFIIRVDIALAIKFAESPKGVKWWQRVWNLHSRSRVRVSACISCKRLGQPGFYSLTWAHKVRFPGGGVSSNLKKKKKIVEQGICK